MLIMISNAIVCMALVPHIFRESLQVCLEIEIIMHRDISFRA